MADDGAPPWPGFVDALSTVLMMMVFFTLLLVLVVGTLSYVVSLKDETAPSGSHGSSETHTVASIDSIEYAPMSATEKLREALTRQALLSEEDIDPNATVSVLALEKLEMEKEALAKQLAEALSAMQASKNAAAQAQAALTKETKAKADLQKALTRIKRLEASRGQEVVLKAGEEKKVPPFLTRIVKGMNSKNRIIILYNKLTSTLEPDTKTELLKWITSNKGAIHSNGLELVATLNFEGLPSSASNSVSFKRLYGLIRVINEDGNIPKSKIKFHSLDQAVPGTNQVVIGIGKLH